MKIYHHLDHFSTLPLAVATTGTFDGVHIGHKTILQRLNRLAQDVGGESVLLTFHPHPRQVLQPDLSLKLINTLEERIDQLEKSGLQHLIVHPFTQAFSRTSSLEFVRNILVERIGVKKLVIGYDHHFGRNREGSFAHLKEYGPLYGFEVEEIPPQDIDQVAVSSTKIRKALEEGAMERVNDYLGYTFSAEAQVVKGDQIGRTIGFPTANCALNDPQKLLPAEGVYVVEVEWKGRRFQGMCNIGSRPTVATHPELRVEVHLFEFHEEIYHENIRISFLHRLRNEQKFNDFQALQEQLRQDEKGARAFFQSQV